MGPAEGAGLSSVREADGAGGSLWGGGVVLSVCGPAASGCGSRNGGRPLRPALTTRGEGRLLHTLCVRRSYPRHLGFLVAVSKAAREADRE